MFKRILRAGAKGIDVAELQRKLTASGYHAGSADGLFGPKTEAAVRAFQATNRLAVDGIVGPQTAAALSTPFEEPGKSPAPGAPFRTLAEIDAHLEKGTAAWYEAAYLICRPDPGTEARIEAAARRVLVGKKSMYKPLEELRGIPWAMTALIHSMECNNNPKGVLHNGQPIIGTGLKTTIVPKGRGPFSNWLEAALDAVDTIALWRVPNWSVGWMLKQMEAFNGLGYLKYHPRENSPYLWACTNINDGTGKYVADGKWSETADADGQVGAAAILRQLEAMGEFSVTYSTVKTAA